jgi:hypothetical protein
MKRVVFLDSIVTDNQTQQTVCDFLNNSFPDNIFNFNTIEVKTELPETKNYTVVGNSLYSMLFFIEFVLKFTYNLLYNSNAATNIKPQPYDISLEVCIDFENRKFRLHVFVDDDIYGLVVGKKYIYVRNLIQCMLPIMSKIKYDGEVRFFPESRYGSVNDVNDWE